MLKLLIIAGATASGKSAVAVKLAKEYNGEIINADSMQIYRGLDIGTAKITQEQMQGVPHYMINVAEPHENYSASEYASAAKQHIENIARKGKLPILSGGTGLYIESVIYPFTLSEAKPDGQYRKELEQSAKERGADYLHSLLKKIDPLEAEKIHPNNIKRVIRALEICKVTGSTKSSKIIVQKPLEYDALMIVLDTDRKELYNRIDARVDVMIKSGLKGELDKYLPYCSKELQSMKAIGYREFYPYYEGSSTFDECIYSVKLNSRHYAKRQITWFKHYPFAEWYDLKKQADIINKRVFEWYNS